MNRLRVAVVTGAARGIGAGVARRLSLDGLPVAVLDRDIRAARATVHDIEARGGRAVAWECDVASQDQVAAVVADVAERLGSPSVLVNNAGFARDGEIAAMDLADWDAVLGVHLTGSFLMTRAVLPHMRSAGWGRVVNISSISAQGHAGRVNYCAAKAGMHGFVKGLAVELGPHGVTVNAVAPGLIVTAMTEVTAARRGLSLAGHLQQAAATIPVRRVGQPDDIANAVAFFAGEDAGFITGQVLYVSGGPAD